MDSAALGASPLAGVHGALGFRQDLAMNSAALGVSPLAGVHGALGFKQNFTLQGAIGPHAC
jgi:hypothetical protein